MNVQSDENYHFLNFQDMFKKTELMIFTEELPESYFNDLSELNPNVTIFVDEDFNGIIKIFQCSHLKCTEN